MIESIVVLKPDERARRLSVRETPLNEPSIIEPSSRREDKNRVSFSSFLSPDRSQDQSSKESHSEGSKKDQLWNRIFKEL